MTERFDRHRQPWKQDETYIAEIVRNMLATGDAVVPRMAGETFMEKPPLFYWVAGALATLTSPVLPLHDGARLATGFFVLLACAALARCGRDWIDPQFGRTTVFVLLACVGLAAFSHLMVTDTALVRDPNYHRLSDTIDKLDFERLARVVVGLEATLLELAR